MGLRPEAAGGILGARGIGRTAAHGCPEVCRFRGQAGAPVLPILAVGVLVALVGCAQRAPRIARPAPLPRVAARVILVIDGDTVKLERIGPVRLIGIDTPERGEPGYEPGKEFVQSRVEGKQVSVEVCPISPRDPYGRARAILYYTPPSGGEVCLNQELVKEGLARVRGFRPCHVDPKDWETAPDRGDQDGM